MFHWFKKKATFQVPRGVKPGSTLGVEEAYEVIISDTGFTRIIMNVSAEKIWTTFMRLGQMVQAPGFGILEVPTNEHDLPPEAANNQSSYNDTYHLPQVSFPEFVQSLTPLAELVVHDGLIQCGFASHQTTDEVFIGPYKVFNIYANEPQKYFDELSKMGIPRRDKIRTLRCGNTLETPGYLEVLEVNGQRFEPIIENQLKPRGWFLYEQTPAN